MRLLSDLDDLTGIKIEVGDKTKKKQDKDIKEWN